MAERFDVAVIGGGAAGMSAAIAAAREGRSTVILERMPRLGRKVLATGGGRCNLSNERVSAGAYASSDPALVASVVARFGPGAIAGFFEDLGLRLASEGGRIYPATQQAASVVKVLELEVRRRRVDVRTGFRVAAIERRGSTLAATSEDGRRVEARTIVLCGGGRSYPALGSDGSAYGPARALGHSLVEPVPSCVPLLAKDRTCHLLQGQKVRVRAAALVGGRTVAEAEGDALFTPYGVSGTAVLDVSTPLSIALNRERRGAAALALDLLPDMAEDRLAAEIRRRLEEDWEAGDVVTGLLPEKFGRLAAGLLRAHTDADHAAAALAAALKDIRFDVQGTRGWNEAEFTSGGIDAREVDPERLASRLVPGLHFAGEILDVQGPRGGYNLAWAWASGAVAGRAAAAAVPR